MSEVKLDQDLGSVYFLPEELPDPSETVMRFTDTLAAIREVPFQNINIPELIGQSLERPHKSLTQGCVEVLRELTRDADHVYFYSHDTETIKELQGLSDLLISRTSIGETSAHQVFFAALSDGERKVRVAVKPFQAPKSAPEKAITDWSNTLLARVGGLHTFRPLGFVIDGDRGYTLTERQDDIEPMDNADWTQALSLPEKHSSMIEDLKKVGPCLARLHDIGCFHGDPQLKNLVIAQRGSVHLIDWEAATFISQPNWWKQGEDKRLLMEKKATRDLRVLFGSLARSVADKGVGLLDGLTPRAQLSYFRELVLTPYVTERLSLLEDIDANDIEPATVQIAEIESSISSYIQNGDLQATLSRTRHQ